LNQHVRLLRSAMFALAATAGCYSATVSAQTPADWQNGAYAYSAQGTPLRTVLQDFASSHGVNLRLGDVPDSDDALAAETLLLQTAQGEFSISWASLQQHLLRLTN